MPMNKAEKSAFDALQHELRLVRAFNLGVAIAPDLKAPEDDSIISGWKPTLGNTDAVRTWSGRFSHGNGAGPDPINPSRGSQGGVDLYSTESLALMAMRHRVARKAAEALVELDARIEEVQAAEALKAI